MVGAGADVAAGVGVATDVAVAAGVLVGGAVDVGVELVQATNVSAPATANIRKRLLITNALPASLRCAFH